MAFSQSSDFAGPSQSRFTPQNNSSASLAERKGSLGGNSSGFHGSQQEWHEVGLDPKHVDDNMDDLNLGPGSSLSSGQFKHETSWSPHEQSANFVQSGDFESLMPDYSVHNPAAVINIPYDSSAPTTQSGPSTTGNSSALAALHTPGQYPISSRSQNWVQTPTTDEFDFSPLTPQGARQVPVFATSTSILRRDGIRKKNARFEIPAERNLRTIDQLISQTSDETEIKELKQQKRLLRNRQAALDSRQRKKQHTERLEEEKKQYTNLLTEMDEELGSMKLRESDWMRQRDELAQNNNRLHQWCQQLQAEKEEALRAHTIESGQLRKENSMLLEQLQRVDASGMSVPSSAGLVNDFSDFEHLSIQSNPWENFQIQNGFALESGSGGQTDSSSLPKNVPLQHKEDRMPTSSLLLMLLLCGAWIVSKGSVNDSEILPSVPEDLRAASSAVINDLYKNSGIAVPGTDADHDPSQTLPDSDASHISQDAGTTTLSGQLLPNFAMEGITPSMAHIPHQRDVFDTANMQSRDPRSDAAHMGHIMRDAIRSTQPGGSRPRLSSTDTYTRSLLIDKVPSQVLKDFAQMVARGRGRDKESGALELDRPAYD